jgi:Uma2 family endonuclease
MATAAPIKPLLLPDIEQFYTAEELLAFPPYLNFELIKGRLREYMAPASSEHGYFTYDLAFEIGSFVRENRLGYCFASEMGFLLQRDPDTVLAPDFAFVSYERLPKPPARGFVPVAPDMVIETRSPSDRGPAVEEKMREWLSADVRLAIDLVPSRQRLTVYRPGVEPVRLGANDTLEGYDVLPGFTLPLSRLFSSHLLTDETEED